MVKWKKIVENGSLGELFTVMGDTCKILQNTEPLELYKNIVEEGITVAIADDAKIQQDFKDILINKLLNYPDTEGSSMLTDQINRRPIKWKA